MPNERLIKKLSGFAHYKTFVPLYAEDGNKVILYFQIQRPDVA